MGNRTPHLRAWHEQREPIVPLAEIRDDLIRQGLINEESRLHEPRQEKRA